MQQTKSQAIKLAGKFGQMNKNVDGIISDLDDTLKQMDADEKTQVSKIQMDFVLVQPRMKMYQAYWIVSDF
jgi:phosphatidate phosphatase APP1